MIRFCSLVSSGCSGKSLGLDRFFFQCSSLTRRCLGAVLLLFALPPAALQEDGLSPSDAASFPSPPPDVASCLSAASPGTTLSSSACHFATFVRRGFVSYKPFCFAMSSFSFVPSLPAAFFVGLVLAC